MVGRAFEVCRAADIPVGESRGFAVEVSGSRIDIFLVRTPSLIVAYRNSCPHTGGPLDWVPDQFLNAGGDLIQCATHGALFRIEDGFCIKGPCSGRCLTALPVELAGSRLSVLLDTPTSRKARRQDVPAKK